MAADGTSQIQLVLERLKLGEESARNDLIAMTQERLRIIARRMLRQYPSVRAREGTDDVLQGALIRLNRALQDLQLQSARDLICLATAHLRRECIDLARKYGHRPELRPAGSGRLAEVPAGGSSMDPLHLEDWARLHEAIKALPPELCEVFDLLWYQGLVQREAASVLGISPATLKRRWHDARLAVGPAALALLQRSPR